MTTTRTLRTTGLAAVACALLFAGLANGRGQTLRPAEAIQHLGEHATVCGTVANAKYASRSRGRPTFLNLDRPYPNHVFTILIWGEHRAKFGQPERDLDGERVCATGTITAYKGRAQIIVESPGQLRRAGD